MNKDDVLEKIETKIDTCSKHKEDTVEIPREHNERRGLAKSDTESIFGRQERRGKQYNLASWSKSMSGQVLVQITN